MNKIFIILFICISACNNYDSRNPCPKVFEYYPLCESSEFIDIDNKCEGTPSLYKVKIKSWVKTPFDQEIKGFKVPKFYFDGYINRDKNKIYYRSKKNDIYPCLLMDFAMSSDSQVIVEGKFIKYYHQGEYDVINKKYQLSRLPLSDFLDQNIMLFRLENFGFLRASDDLYILADQRKGPIGWFTAVRFEKDDNIYINSFGGNISFLFTYCSNFKFCPNCHE